MNKKKIITIIISVLLVLGLAGAGIYFNIMKYANDKTDTEELFRENVAAIGYENTIETAIAQTALYDVIKNHFSSPLPEGKTEKKAALIGYDGCRADMIDKSGAIGALLEEGASITLNYCGGVNYPEINTQATSTAPGWCSILTGQWADVHGITANSITKSMDTKTLFTSLAEEKLIDNASFITRWKGHFTNDDSTYLLEKQYCEEKGLGVSFNRTKNDEASHIMALEQVKKADCTDFLFVIYEHTDSTGHNRGFSINNPLYKEAFYAADKCGLELLEAIKGRESFDTEDWLIIITSDHGGIGTEHGHESIQERMTFTVMNASF